MEFEEEMEEERKEEEEEEDGRIRPRGQEDHSTGASCSLATAHLAGRGRAFEDLGAGLAVFHIVRGD